MNLDKILNRATYLRAQSILQLQADLFMEFDPNMSYANNRGEMPDYGMIMWFLRNVTYAPMTLLQETMDIRGTGKRGAAAAEVIRNYEDSLFESPASLAADNYEKLQLMRAISDQYYGLKGNPYLDRMSDEQRDCALYLASLECGVRDSSRPQGGGFQDFAPTPSEEPLAVTLKDIVVRITELGHTYDEVCCDYHKIISNN